MKEAVPLPGDAYLDYILSYRKIPSSLHWKEMTRFLLEVFFKDNVFSQCPVGASQSQQRTLKFLCLKAQPDGIFITALASWPNRSKLQAH
jgi:hypothetical protein